MHTDFAHGDPASRYRQICGKVVAKGGDATKAAEAQRIIEAAIKNYGQPDSRTADCESD
jgi:hypothetical protein